MDTFVFNSITDEELADMSKNAKVFNLTEDSIKSEKVILASVDDEQWGSAVERLDIAVWDKKNSVWKLLDIHDKIEGYNEIPLGYVFEGQAFSRVLVIIRRMSSFLMDKSTYGQTVYIYSVVSDSFKDLVKDPVFLGRMAQSRIYLDGTPRQVYRQIRNTFTDKEKREGLVEYVKSSLSKIGDDLGG